VADDGTALYWNPAGLSQMSQRELAAMHGLIFEDRSHNFLVFTFPVPKFAISVGWMRFGVSHIQERNIQGELIGEFGDSENLYMMGSGYQIISIPAMELHVGLTAKYFYHSLYNYRGSGFGIDLGALSYFHFSGIVEKIGIGLVFQNVGAKIKWNTPSNHQDDFPTSFRLGSAISIKPIPFKLVLDLEKTEKRNLRVHTGGEYWIRILALRAGLNHDKFTAGAGLTFNMAQYVLMVDYAFTTDEVADQALHFFMLNFRF
jgi:hypothetical protein